LREDYKKFHELDTEILAIAADTQQNAVSYFRKKNLPFPGLIDNEHAVFDLYDVQSKLISIGQRPGLFIVDKEGRVRFAQVGFQQWEIPTNKFVLEQLEKLKGKR